ncbi:hypothetical protein [Amycolatopsis sp. lyj-109]|uniref:hypothetical protein n=1 Tax=Amycolatopsis sp. lyj-109 TaxID=2789287 RepID=UPI00397ACB6E
MYEVWLRAVVLQQLNHWTGFLALKVGSDAEAQREFDRILAAIPDAMAGSVPAEMVQQHIDDLVELARRWSEDQHYPGELPPGEQDAQARNHVKDLLREDCDEVHRQELANFAFFLEIRARDAFRLLRDQDRENAHYLYGRVCMALDLGHLKAAEHEWTRLQNYVARRS